MPGRKLTKAAPGEPNCGFILSNGSPCPRPAGFATDHPGTGRCRRHGGSLKNGIKKVASAELAELLGDPADVDPGEALLYCVALASQELKWIRTRLGHVTEPTHLTPVGNLGGPQKGWVGMQEEFDIWVQAQQAAVERLARYSKMALDAGVAERMVSLAEKMGEFIAPLIGGVVAELQLTPAQQEKLPAIVERNMLQLEARTGPGRAA